MNIFQRYKLRYQWDVKSAITMFGLCSCNVVLIILLFFAMVELSKEIKAAEVIEPLPPGLHQLPYDDFLEMGAIGCPSPEILRRQEQITEQYGGGVTLVDCKYISKPTKVVLIRHDKRLALVRLSMTTTLYFPSSVLKWEVIK